MSKQSEARDKQGYVAKAIPQICGNCAHYRCDMELPPWMQEENKLKPGTWGDNYLQEQNKRCGLGGFAVKKMGNCKAWEAKS